MIDEMIDSGKYTDQQIFDSIAERTGVGRKRLTQDELDALEDDKKSELK